MRISLRTGASGLAVAALFATQAVLLPSPALAAQGDQAVTVTGSGAFKDLRVSVSKTRELRNEVVQVSWSGARQTRGNFGIDYLQIFQCWGDAAAGPDREQCQFGGLSGDTRGGAQVASRQVTYDIKDPQETYTPTRERSVRYVPFSSVTGKTTEAGLSEFFDGTTTNEVPFAATRSDGGGVVPFEVQTSLEAPGLGCGDPIGAAAPAPFQPGAPSAAPRPSPSSNPQAQPSATPTATMQPSSTATAATQPTPPTTTAAAGSPRQCWLVVVPRNDREVDGSQRTASSTSQLLSSPLSATNWAQRLVVPLSFVPVGQPCPIGKAERPVVGQENVVEAVSSWQPALCRGNGPLYSFSQVPDALARRQAVGDAPGLSLTSRRLTPTEVPAGRKPVYAPVALTGVTVAFNIESQSAFSAPAEVKSRDGQRITTLNLTPRLVAKLLTQSYRLGAANPDRPGIEKNPLDLTRDPDFLRSNPAFAQLRFVGIADILVPSGLSDGVALVWQWILGDADARAFLSGTPDPSGMLVNPAYKGTAQQEGFPKSDPICLTFLTSQPPLCTLDARPYAADGQDAARAAARGDSLSRSTYDSSATPPTYRKSLPQPTGSRAILALTDAASAARYGLNTAALRNGAGQFVEPSDTGLLAGLAAMTDLTKTGVLLPVPWAKDAALYPLSTMTYAVSTPAQLTPAARKDYGTFLRYAAGEGQVAGLDRGQLPPGYAPLPAALRAQTIAAAKAIESAVDPTQAAEASDQPESSLPLPTRGFGGSTPLTGPQVIGAPAPPTGPFTPPSLPAGAQIPAMAAAPTERLLLAGTTPADPVGMGRYGVLVALSSGLLAALLASMLWRPRRRIATP